MQAIQPREAAERLKGAKRVVLDVRTPAEFSQAHIVGAVNVPLGELTDEALSKAGVVQGEEVFVVCQKGARGERACGELHGRGFQVTNIAGGTEAWIAANLPVTTGQRKVISIERQVRIVAGALVLSGTVLGVTINGGFLVVPAFVGAGLVFAGVTDWCGMALVLGRMPWNR